MNISITPITTSPINKTVTVPATSAATAPASDVPSDDNTCTVEQRAETICFPFNSNPCKRDNAIKSVTTPQNCFDILTSIQYKLVPSDCSYSENYTSTCKTTTINFTSSLPASSGAKKLPLEAFGDNQSKNHILSEELKNSSISENCANVDSSIKSASESLQTSLHRSVETLQIETEKDNLDTGRLQDNRNLDGNEICFNSENIRCDEDCSNKSSENSENLLRNIDSRDGIEKIKTISRLSERAKKKSWYNILYPNYKSRSQDFRKLFKEVPNDERLIVDYSCALYRDLLIQGRLYISQNYVCFHANILGWETCLVIKWMDVTSITKEKTAIVIPNAISICTIKENFFLSSFTTRDKTFLILFRIWQNTLMNKPMLSQEIWQLVHYYYGDELGLTTDDEDYVDPTVEYLDENFSNLEFASGIDDTRSLNIYKEEIERFHTDIYQPIESSSGSTASNSNSGNYSTNCMSSKTMKSNAKEITLISAKPDDGLSSNSQAQQASATSSACSRGLIKESKQNMLSVDSKRKMPKNCRQREENTSKSAETLPTDISDSSDSEESIIPFVATAECNSPHEGRQLVHTILPINIDALFNILFSKSKFLSDFHAMRKSTDLVFGEWITNEDGHRTRTFNVTVQLAASVGPKTSKVTEFQVMRECSKPGELYSIDINNVNSGIPYADSFSVLVHYCLVKTVDDHTMLSVHSQIKYKKSVWGVVKGFIEKNAWAGLDDFYTSLLHSLQSETCIPPAKCKGRRPRRVIVLGTASQIRSPEELPILKTKPEPVQLCGIAQSICTRHQINSHVMAAEVTSKFRWISLFVLVLLCFLIIVNIILLLKLWKLEERIEENMSTRAREPNLSSFKQLPTNYEEWVELLHQQELLHETELKKWHTVLQTAIELLRKVSVVCQNMFQTDKRTKKFDQIGDEL